MGYLACFAFIFKSVKSFPKDERIHIWDKITERQPYFVLTWRAVKKNIVPIKKNNVFWRCFGSSGCNWTSLLFVSFKCFVTLAFHAFGDFKSYSFHKSFRKTFQWDPFLKNCLHDITVLSQTFWLSRKRNGLERRCANRQFPPNVKILHRNSVSLDKLPTFRKKFICKKH